MIDYLSITKLSLGFSLKFYIRVCQIKVYEIMGKGGGIDVWKFYHSQVILRTYG